MYFILDFYSPEQDTASHSYIITLYCADKIQETKATTVYAFRGLPETDGGSAGTALRSGV